MARTIAGLAALLLAAGTHALAAVWFLVGTCAVSDVADRVPAPASTQGRLCDASQHWLNAVPWVVLGLSAVLAVILAVALLRSATWRWVGLTAWLWLPLLASAALAAPDDACSPAQRGELPARDCRTTTDA